MTETDAELLDAVERRLSLRADIAGELRLSVRGEILLVHACALVDRISRIVVDPRPARRDGDGGERLGLKAVLDDGRNLWIGETCSLMASAVAIARQLCMVRLDDNDNVVVRNVPIDSTVAGNAQTARAAPGTLGDLQRHFDGVATCVALTSQPGNPEPDVPMISALRRLIKTAGAAAA